MGDLSKPPKGVPPERIFRTLLRTPRPVVPIDFRLRGAEDVPLVVRALSSAEWAEAREEAGSLGPTSARQSAMVRAVIARALLVPPRRPAFASGEEVGALGDHEFSALAEAVLGALSWACPTFDRADPDTWRPVLEEGARACSSELAAVATTVDVFAGANGKVLVEDPLRFFGVPPSRLLDGHFMAYRGAADALRGMWGIARRR